MGGIARRLDHDPRQIKPGRQDPVARKRGANRMHARKHFCEKVLRWAGIGHDICDLNGAL
jgi:hypothetical protein